MPQMEALEQIPPAFALLSIVCLLAPAAATATLSTSYSIRPASCQTMGKTAINCCCSILTLLISVP